MRMKVHPSSERRIKMSLEDRLLQLVNYPVIVRQRDATLSGLSYVF